MTPLLRGEALTPLLRERCPSPRASPRVCSPRDARLHHLRSSPPSLRHRIHPTQADYQQLPTTDPEMFPGSECAQWGTERAGPGTESDGECGAWRAKGRDFFGSLVFQGTMACLILLNAIVIGLETDHDGWQCWNTLEDCFLAVFFVEVALRLVFFGPQVFTSCSIGDCKWNVFDLVLLCLGMVEKWYRTFQPFHTKADTVFLFRTIRLMRILRIFRIVRFLRQLYTLAMGFALSSVAVFWVTFLFSFVIYVSSVILVRTMGRTEPDAPHYALLHDRFGNVYSAMLTLFQLMSQPDLQDYREILYEEPLFTAFIASYVIFVSFGMIAMLNGVISESMFEKNCLRVQEEEKDRRASGQIIICHCEALFESLPKNAEDEATRATILNTLPEIRDVFEEAGVVFATDDLIGMIEVIDADGNGSISREEFRHFIVQMAEGVRPMLIMELYYAMRGVKQKLERQELCLERLLMLREDSRSQDCMTRSIAGLTTMVSQLQSSSRMQRDQFTDATGALQKSVSCITRACEDSAAEIRGELSSLRSDFSHFQASFPNFDREVFSDPSSEFGSRSIQRHAVVGQSSSPGARAIDPPVDEVDAVREAPERTTLQAVAASEADVVEPVIIPACKLANEDWRGGSKFVAQTQAKASTPIQAMLGGTAEAASAAPAGVVLCGVPQLQAPHLRPYSQLSQQRPAHLVDTMDVSEAARAAAQDASRVVSTELQAHVAELMTRFDLALRVALEDNMVRPTHARGS